MRRRDKVERDTTLPQISEKIQDASLIMLLVFTPLAKGSTPRWLFCIAVILALISISAMLIKRLWADQRLLPTSCLDAPLALLLILTALSATVSIYQYATTWALIRTCLYAAVFFLALDTTANINRTRTMVWTIIIMGAVLSVYGLFRYSAGYDSRVSATFVNKNHLAGYLEMSMGLCAGLLLFKGTNKRLLLLVLFSFMASALMNSMSRGGWASAFLGMIILTVLYYRKKMVARIWIWTGTIAALSLAALLMLGANPVFDRAMTMENPRDPSLLARIMAWSGTLEIIKENPWRGTGLGTFPWSFPRHRPAGLTMRYYEAHNDYVQIVSETGLPVLIPIIWGGILVYRKGLKTIQSTESRTTASLGAGALTGISALLFHEITDFNLQITANGVLFSALIGLAAGLARWDLRKRSNANERQNAKNFRIKIVDAPAEA